MREEILKVVGVVSILLQLSVIYIYFRSDGARLNSDQEIIYALDNQPLKVNFYIDSSDKVTSTSFSKSLYGVAQILGSNINDSIQYFDNNIDELELFKTDLENRYFNNGLKNIGVTSINQLMVGEDILDSSYLLISNNSIELYSPNRIDLNSTIIDCVDSSYFMISYKLVPIIIVDQKNRIEYLHSKVKPILMDREKEVAFWQKINRDLNSIDGINGKRTLLINSIESFLDSTLLFYSNKTYMASFIDQLFKRLDIELTISNYLDLIERSRSDSTLFITEEIYSKFLEHKFNYNNQYNNFGHSKKLTNYLYISNGSFIVNEEKKQGVKSNWINRIRTKF